MRSENIKGMVIFFSLWGHELLISVPIHLSWTTWWYKRPAVVSVPTSWTPSDLAGLANSGRPLHNLWCMMDLRCRNVNLPCRRLQASYEHCKQLAKGIRSFVLSFLPPERLRFTIHVIIRGFRKRIDLRDMVVNGANTKLGQRSRGNSRPAIRIVHHSNCHF